ncbi:hypothetical protein VXE69_13965 [Mycolicibacterium cosmeticum]
MHDAQRALQLALDHSFRHTEVGGDLVGGAAAEIGSADQVTVQGWQ